jgi:DNA-damage-inducible protein D
MRDAVVARNLDLTAAAAAQAGLVSGKDFATFHDHGYRGLYGGETARQIAARKGIGPREKILDWMEAEELAANWFRITQTEAKLRREGTDTPTGAHAAHFEVGRVVRQTIADLGGTMPEELPTPSLSVEQLRRAEALREQKRLEAERQPSLFGDPEGGDDDTDER